MKMKKGFRVGCFGLALAMGMSGGSITAQARNRYFNDFYNSNTWYWAENAIHWAYEEGIAEGKGNDCFDADGKITRAEAATMLVNFKGIDAEKYNSPSEKFKDLGENWYTKYVNAAYENGLAEGKGEDIFDPEGELTRAEAATMLVKAMGYDMVTDEAANFDDIADAWYTDYINTAYKHGIVAGKTEKKFEPISEVTRAEMVTMMYATLKENDNLENIYSIFVDSDNTNFTMSNEVGESLNCEKGVFSGSMAEKVKEKNGYWYVPMQSSDVITLETENETMSNMEFNRINGDIDIRGTNVKKVQVYNNGTVKMYSANTYSKEEELVTLEIAGTNDFTIINAEGQKLTLDKFQLSGDMEVKWSSWTIGGLGYVPSDLIIYVKASENFTFIPSAKDRRVEVMVGF